jgi:hypothetical protein
MTHLKHLSTSVLALAALLLFIPSTSFAATMSVMQLPTTAQQLSSELSQINAELLSGAVAPVATFTLSPGQSTQQASAVATSGLLTVSLTNFEHTNPLPSTPAQPVVTLAKVSLQYMPCVAAAPIVCLSTASSTYPAVSADLSSGQSTNYLHYQLTLTSLSTSTATFQVYDSSFADTIQSQFDVVAARVHAFLGN